MRHRTAPAARRRTPAVARGAAVLALALLTGCSSASSGSASSQTTTVPGTVPPSATSSAPAGGTTTATSGTAPATSTPAGQELRITVTGKKVEPPPDTVEVKAGEPVRFVITSDHDDEIHLHGVEIEKPITAGGTVTIDTRYPDPGSYEVEMHSPSLLLVRVLVR